MFQFKKTLIISFLFFSPLLSENIRDLKREEVITKLSSITPDQFYFPPAPSQNLYSFQISTLNSIIPGKITLKEITTKIGTGAYFYDDAGNQVSIEWVLHSENVPKTEILGNVFKTHEDFYKKEGCELLFYDGIDFNAGVQTVIIGDCPDEKGPRVTGILPLIRGDYYLQIFISTPSNSDLEEMKKNIRKVHDKINFGN
jgi:hypothetical protein